MISGAVGRKEVLGHRVGDQVWKTFRGFRWERCHLNCQQMGKEMPGQPDHIYGKRCHTRGASTVFLLPAHLQSEVVQGP